MSTKPISTTTFGLHLMLDAYEADPVKLDDMKRVFHYLHELPQLISMQKLTSPMVIDCEETASGKDPGGISGFVIIAESHISIHTFAKRNFFTMDLYSCRNFENKIPEVLNYSKKMFGSQRHELQVVKRGVNYPSHNP